MEHLEKKVVHKLWIVEEEEGEGESVEDKELLGRNNKNKWNRVENRESKVGSFAKWLTKTKKCSILSQNLAQIMTNPLGMLLHPSKCSQFCFQPQGDIHHTNKTKKKKKKTRRLLYLALQMSWSIYIFFFFGGGTQNKIVVHLIHFFTSYQCWSLYRISKSDIICLLDRF